MSKHEDIYRLALSNEISELERIKSVVDELCENWNIPVKAGFEINLALEEAFTNIVNYAFNDQENRTIEIEFSKINGKLTMTLADDGTAYDPTQKSDPQLDLPLQDRPVGGLGIFLIRKLMDGVEYHRKSEKNFLTLTKNIH